MTVVGYIIHVYISMGLATLATLLLYHSVARSNGARQNDLSQAVMRCNPHLSTTIDVVKNCARIYKTLEVFLII